MFVDKSYRLYISNHKLTQKVNAQCLKVELQGSNRSMGVHVRAHNIN